ncbi:phytoene desaturase family protein [Hydrotalea sandarakina]|jgi:phytoene desaturase|uniref:Phytoene desaturase n=1 Tax=Hydrotalea sandarakina TaxID=1004304 RepID=A0A2W7RPI0_9BACT|nr:phytoene desaturase family protein [Hydrotalea sandarakina]PZX62241.1 phytoene desaturase [Hydrotalea sandarakina]
MKQQAIIIGAGFAGMSAASFMAQAGWDVTVLEKHATPGGRARQMHKNGFVFDMGPSWYWMPDVFERYFAQFGKKVSDYYNLQRLDPSYRVVWADGATDIPANYQRLQQWLESLEPGSAAHLDVFLEEAAYKYKVGIQKLVHKPGRSLTEFLDKDLITGVFKLDVFTNMQQHIARFFKHPKIQQLLAFPVLFLGALPEKTPALYSLMNYADVVGGTWYPQQGGMFRIVEAMYSLAKELGVHFQLNEEVTGLDIQAGKIAGVTTNKANYTANVVIAGADYHHVETKLLPKEYRSYSDAYWEKRTMAPSALLYYVGLNKKIKGITHHTLFFDTDFSVHGQEIYTTKQWPSNPLFYVCAPSVTDTTVAPEGCENLFILIPVATGLEGDTEALRERYFQQVMQRMEQHFGEPLLSSVLFKETFAQSDFIEQYHAFKGNAYGLANTLRQTAVLKPACYSKKVANLFYTGQLTVPGPGVPPALISGEVVVKEVLKKLG